MVEEPREPELIRPYVIAKDKPPPRRTPVSRRPVDDPTVVIDRAEIIDPAGDEPADEAARDDPDGVAPRRRALLPVAAGAGVVAVLLGMYLLWPPDRDPTATPPAYTPTAPAAGPLSTAPGTPRASAAPSSPVADPSVSRRATPSPSGSASPSSSRTTRIAPGASPLPAGPITGVGGRCVDNSGAVTTNGNRIQLYECNGTAAQTWTVQPDGTLRVQGKCLRAGTPARGAGTELWDCDGSPGETWRAQRNGTLVDVTSGLCLDAPGSGNGTPLDITTCTGGKRQRWHLP